MAGKKEKVKGLLRDKPLKETKHYSKKVAAFVLSAFSVVICALAVIGVILIKKNFTNTDAFRELVSNNYILSVIIMIALCAAQVIIALIPGELLEITSGYAFGAWEGALYCLIGITIGSITVILLTRKLGRKFVESIYPREKIDSLPILNDPARRNALTALLFLIPGTPKDLITYIIGITEMRIPTYILLTTASRFPSIIMSTLGGNALGDSRYSSAVIFFVISAVLSLTGYLIYLRISGKKKEKKSNDNITSYSTEAQSDSPKKPESIPDDKLSGSTNEMLYKDSRQQYK